MAACRLVYVVSAELIVAANLRQSGTLANRSCSHNPLDATFRPDGDSAGGDRGLELHRADLGHQTVGGGYAKIIDDRHRLALAGEESRLPRLGSTLAPIADGNHLERLVLISELLRPISVDAGYRPYG